ncbi:sugar phosphate isomerase/epimerase family protein [Peptoanaerobacter stomatis]
MKLSISNIAWESKFDKEVYSIMKENGFKGLEIAPTRVFDNPYDENLNNLLNFKNYIKIIDLELVSMQSLIFNRLDLKLFGLEQKREELKKYLFKAVDFASKLNIKNLVFGSPKNRNMFDKQKDYIIAINFFNELGNYALSQNTVISIEANPQKYGTNFLNTTKEAFNFVSDVNNLGIKLQIDTGTMFINKENLNSIYDYFKNINHVHLSEDNLNVISRSKKSFYKELINMLSNLGYDKYISIEMKKTDLNNVIESIEFISSLCF